MTSRQKEIETDVANILADIIRMQKDIDTNNPASVTENAIRYQSYNAILSGYQSFALLVLADEIKALTEALQSTSATATEEIAANLADIRKVVSANG